ncbi:uncharacterized protein LOC119101242 [Pollicipes pollicipes]|uniref:uncharacterized protein LOC119101242 n=1 Tax=Pollicipes pollicipes TaxID=41117 RepID=UPI0018858B23|nr:uncharacterized protein LOC119101242 [Pollicipes pollicipes]
MTVDPSATAYQVMQCDEDAPAAPANGVLSVPDHRTTGTKATYSCAAGYVFSDGASERVELVCGHVTREWGSLAGLECERPRTTTTGGPETSSVSTTELPVTTEQAEPDYLTLVTIPTTAGLLLIFLMMIWCVRTEGPICSLFSEKKKRTQETP